jgi:hypothetical protein
VSELSKRFETLANRGTRRGVDSVLGDAIASVRNTERYDGMGGSEASDLDILDPEHDDGPPAVAMLDETRPRRTRRSGFAVIGIAALLGVGTLAIAALVGNGGADSPEDAVRQLADAVSHEDMLAAVDVLSPNEVRTMRQSLDGLSRRAQDLRIVADAGRPFAGVDFQFDGLELGTEELAPGFAKVTVHGGTFTAEARREGLAPMLQQAWNEGEGVARAEGPLEDATINEIEPFVVVIRHDGGWYVSPAYTFLEYVRVVNALPPAEYGSGVARAAELGADSPEQAVQGALDAWSAHDWDRLWSMFAPNELPLYDYREALRTLIGQGADPEPMIYVDQFSATSDVHGDTATVTVNANGRYGNDGRWSVDDRCLSFASADEEAGVPGGPLCPSRAAVSAFLFWSPVEDSGNGQLRATTVRRGERWFVSPVGTALDIIDQIGADLDERSVYSFFGLESELPPDGSLVLGEPVRGRADGYLSYVYTFEGQAGQEVVGLFEEAELNRSENFFGGSYGRVLSPDGDELEDGWGIFDGEPARLPVNGTYRVVVRASVPGDFTLTLYDAASAPADVLNPPDPCANPENAPPWCGGYVGEGEECSVDGDVVTCTTVATVAPPGQLCSSVNGTYPCEGFTSTPTTAVANASP